MSSNIKKIHTNYGIEVYIFLVKIIQINGVLFEANFYNLYSANDLICDIVTTQIDLIYNFTTQNRTKN